MVEMDAGPLLARAADEASAAWDVLRSVHVAAWTSPAADAWRALVAGQQVGVARLRAALRDAEPVVVGLGRLLEERRAAALGLGSRPPWVGGSTAGHAPVRRSAGDRLPTGGPWGAGPSSGGLSGFGVPRTGLRSSWIDAVRTVCERPPLAAVGLTSGGGW